MAISSSYGSTLVLYLIVAFLITPSTSNYLSQVCIKSKYPKFCLESCGLNPHRSPSQLTAEAIYVALPIIYNICLNYYQSTNDEFRLSVQDYMIKGLYSSVNAAGNFAQDAAFYCESAFQGILGYVYRSTLTKDNEYLEMYGNIIVSAVNLLFNSSSLQK
ncbi:hypothetical protein R3W88_016142 [Solanum pinnatisectum]|uniref:Pectinesterase inhibitor domain-containing protein n=1 Tax=Solanum pinnatisectum TaxID=50273 RepID=A0AAV9KWR1_9SOLN|nr:hypothetical protein R3W88_016142 [Solanum pinnatisectum]